MKKRFLALTLALLLALSLLAGCGAASKGDTSAAMDENGAAEAPSAPEESAPMEPMPAPDMAPAGDDYFEEDFKADYDMPEASEGGLAGGGETAPEVPAAAALSEKIVYSANLTVETTEFDSAVAALEKMTADFGGFVESSQVYGSTRYREDGSVQVVDRYADYVLRIPSSSFRQCLTRAGEIGNVISSGTNAENITSQFTDQEARQHSLEIQEERLLDMLEKTEDVESLVALESRLSDVRYEIESIERTLRNWQTQVDYSTVSVGLQEVELYTPTAPVQRTFGQQLSDALHSGWRGFVRAMKGLVLGILECLPVLVILAVAAVIVVLVVRRWRIRRRNAEKAAREAAKKPDEEEK